MKNTQNTLENSENLIDRIEKLDKTGVAVTSAFVKGLETAKAIYEAVHAVQDQREHAE